jgi:hypothetical protein
MKRAPRLGPANKFEQSWLDFLAESDLNGFHSIDACRYLATLRNHAGRKYQRIPHAARMTAILKKSDVFARDAESLWWRVGGDSQ